MFNRILKTLLSSAEQCRGSGGSEAQVDGGTTGCNVDKLCEETNADPAVPEELEEKAEVAVAVAATAAEKTVAVPEDGSVDDGSLPSDSPAPAPDSSWDWVSPSFVSHYVVLHRPSVRPEPEGQVNGWYFTAGADEASTDPESEVIPAAGAESLPVFGPSSESPLSIPLVSSDSSGTGAPTPAGPRPSVLIKEQDMAYQKALEEAQNEEARKAKEEKLLKEKQEAEEQRRLNALKKLEPEPDEGEGVITVRFHTDDATLVRRFGVHQAIHQAFLFLATHGYFLDDYIVSFSPGVLLTDSDLTFDDKDLRGRFVLHVSKRIHFGQPSKAPASQATSMTPVGQ